MAAERDERSEPRKSLRNAYVEYSKGGTGLMRLFKSGVRRGLIVNISKSGLAFRTSEPVEAGQHLAITLRFPAVREQCKLKAEVRWVLPERKIGQETYTHIAGARFVEYSPEAWAVIQRVLKG